MADVSEELVALPWSFQIWSSPVVTSVTTTSVSVAHLGKSELASPLSFLSALVLETNLWG